MHPRPRISLALNPATGRRQYNGVPGTKASNAAQNWERK
jgi:hypothetical protein